MNRSTSQIVAVACALLLAQLAAGSAEAEVQQESSAVRKVPKIPEDGTRSATGAPICGDGTCQPGEDACNCPQDCSGVCPCVLFDNEAEFVAFIEGQGSKLNALETFEESILPPGDVDGMDDALRGGVPNLPDGFPFPNGLDVLSLCVQSNTLGGAPDDKSPRGVNGLRALSVGVLGAISDLVLANMFADSLDLLIIEPGYRAVGFNTISFLGSDMTEIRVYGRDNTTILVAGIASADEAGSNFFGVSCSEEIGRINIFDTGDGAEGGDNIQMWGFFGPAECGNGVCEVDESCGLPDDPPPVCVEDCGICFCGDGEVNEQGEECDSPDDAACPGECFPPGAPNECTCPGAVNDDCQDAIAIFDGATDYDTTGTSTDGLQHDACQFCGQTHMDIWYQYEATCAGDLTVSTCDTALYDTDLVVYSGRHPDDWTCPPGDGPLLGCNDDTPGCAGFTSVVTVPVTAGNWYTIRVGGWEAGDQGPGTVTLICDGGCGACPTDVDGSGATDAFDLAFLLGNWGPATPESQCLDADGNEVIDAFDLAVLLGAWGACL